MYIDNDMLPHDVVHGLMREALAFRAARHLGRRSNIGARESVRDNWTAILADSKSLTWKGCFEERREQIFAMRYRIGQCPEISGHGINDVWRRAGQ